MSKTLLLKIKKCINILEQHKDDPRIINEVAGYILSEEGFLNESEEAAQLLNTIAEVIEGGETNVDNILVSFLAYFKSLINLCKVTIYYIGDVDNFKQLTKNLDNDVVSEVCYLPGNVDNLDELHLGLNAALAPIVIYTPFAGKLISSMNLSLALAVIPYYELMFSSGCLTSEVKYNYAAWLEKKYQMVSNTNVHTLILGNSYGYYAFPEQSIERAVNLSMHSLSIKQAHALVFHTLRDLPHIDHFVFCFGLFDLYSDLLKTKDNFNKMIIDSMSLLFTDNDIATDNILLGNSIQMLSSLIFKRNSNEKTVWPENYILSTYDAITTLINSKVYVDPHQYNELAIMRAQDHSKLVKNSMILQENKILLNEMVDILYQNGKTATWVVPPFPELYVKNINADMKNTNRQVLEQWGDKKLHFIDWSGNRNFERKYFRDGDHLNFLGAKKLVIKLRKVGVNI